MDCLDVNFGYIQDFFDTGLSIALECVLELALL